MDIHLIPGAAATAAERGAIDAAIGGADGRRRDLLLPALHAALARVGWISEGALNHICTRLDVPPAEAYGVASFYAMFALAPRPATIVHVCDDIACRALGAERVCADLAQAIGPEGQAGLDGAVAWHRSPCLGQCERGPAVLYQRAGEGVADSTLTDVNGAAAVIAHLQNQSGAGVPAGGTGVPAGRHPSVPQAGDPALRLLRRVGRVDPERLDAYRADGGYAALRRAFALGAEQTLREIVDAKLVGRGGAAFPTGRKWDAVAHSAVRPHYLVCNADESEPGTFKDRILMEEDPFALIEAMTIAGFVTGCEDAYVYIRGEYPLATARLTSAIAQARLLGPDVLGEGVRFDIELRRGAGAYICGEETALFNSIEGLRGEPRNKPPYPVQAGLFHKPTVINNVETLVNVLDIVLEGGPAFAATGTPGSTGTKLFCVSGTVQRAGLYEVPFGVTLRELIDRAGGLREGRALQAVLLGGAAGMFVTPGEIDVPLTFEGTRAAGVTLGSGVVMVFDDTVDLGDTLLRIAAFFRDESCGQCVPCRVGTVRQEEALRRLAAARPLTTRDGELALIDELAMVMRDASICGLGHTASTAIQTGIRKFGVFGSRT